MALVAVALLGFALRELNARSANFHDDELHYVADATWADAHLGLRGTWSFLYDHPHRHPHLEPGHGIVGNWGEHGDFPRLGHPCLFADVVGLVFAVTHPAWPRAAMFTARTVNAVVDTVALLYVPTLVVALGGSVAFGLAAAALYAVFPLAVTYGSLAYLDAFLAPLVVLLAIASIRHDGRFWGWVRLGVLTGLVLAVKETGLILLPLVLGVVAVRRRISVGGLVAWSLVTLGVVALFTNPVAYVSGILHPLDPFYAPRFEPFTSLVKTLRFASDPLGYYWLGFRRHGQPLAPLMARVHPVLTPLYGALFVAGLLVLVVRREALALIVLYVPVLLSLLILPPSDGFWRLHFLSPLECAAIGLVLSRSRPRTRIVLLAVAVLAGVTALLPARPSAGGLLDLGDMLFMNPQIRQEANFYLPATRPLAIELAPGAQLSRLVWLPDGDYRVFVIASSPTTVSLGGHSWEVHGPERMHVQGSFHRLEIAAPIRATLTAIMIRRDS